MSGNLAKAQGRTSIAELRAGLSTAKPALKPPSEPPPKRRKGPKSETADERAEKAERQAMLQHTTSLLDNGKKSKKPYVRVGERPEKKKGGLFFQLLLVMIIAGGVAYALDPSIVPPEWMDKAKEWFALAQEQIKQWMPT